MKEKMIKIPEGVRNIRCDSRLVKKGDIFIAVKGSVVDGHRFIASAIAKGAGVIVSEKDFDVPAGVEKILVKDSSKALSEIANIFHGYPFRKLKSIGITGTNGKTTITYILESMIRSAGMEPGVIGTINYRFRDKVIRSGNTTPGPIELQSVLGEMVSTGVNCVVMEVSSHSLDQRRIEGILFDVVIFTNVTSDHLDYHGTRARYFAAKKRLLKYLKPGGAAILNNDDKMTASLNGSVNKKVITYGMKNGSQVRGRSVELSADGSRFTAATPVGEFRVGTRLIGAHNVSNILAAISAAIALGVGVKSMRRGLDMMPNVPGRLEAVNAGQGFKVFVDYAHTEDAMVNVLRILRGISGGRIITVFGCGGDRDRTKRPLMGRAACRFSDHAVITSDNPRFEAPGDIIDEIESGIRGGYSNYDIEPDRREAIRKALGLAVKGDIVLIAGKGHEPYQIIKDKALPFDDREVARDVLRGKG